MTTTLVTPRIMWSLHSKSYPTHGYSKAQAMPVEKFYSACALNCPDLCAYVVHVEDGKIVRLEGDENHPYTLGRCCPKGYAHILRTYYEDRLRFPLRKQSDGTFKRISWDTASNEIAERMNEAKEKHGPSSVGIYSGSGNDGMAPRYASRFSNAFGCRMIPGIVEICFEGAYEGARFNVGPFPPHELSDWANSKCIVIWGTNKFESSIRSKRVIQEAIDGGAKLIVIDPRTTPYAKMADIHTTIRPGTDGALALGIANEIIQRNLYNKEFVEKYVVGFEEYKERVAQYDKKRVSEITWVDVNTIEEIAITFATHGPALITTAPAGMNHYTNGTWTARGVHSILAICGYLGVSGGGFQYLSSDNSPFNSAAITLSNLLTDDVEPVVPSGTYVPEYVLSQTESPLKVFVIQAASPVTQWPNTNRTFKALDKIPFKVCIDLELTDTARLCDIVLPATLIFEHHNIVHSELHRIVQYAPLIIEPIGEAKSELDIWTEIARRVGISQHFEISEVEAIKMVLQSEECKHITLEELMKHPEGIRTTAPSIPFEDKKFLTASGKVELYSEQLKKMGHDPLPFHEEPLESPTSTPEVFKEYPLIMISGRLRERLHSQYTTVEVGGSVRSYSHCTSCQKCVKDCPDEAISLTSPTPRQMQDHLSSESESQAPLRQKLGGLVKSLAVSMENTPVSVPSEMTGMLVPIWDATKCIGCRECELDICPYEVVNQPLVMKNRSEIKRKRMYLRMHPSTAHQLGLNEGDRIDIESRRGFVEGVRLELTQDIDPRIVWSSDGWWAEDGNINLLTEDNHTAFGHTPGFNSVLVRVKKSNSG
ncbi:MAG: molybdopterin-dependent oxidoreductase [Candidatus Thorarchaeota archaeon]|nr:molybdopterin-dependent oxidoreductase [Candidatus Thorarchaeota archaeon]